jgi:hypothetical protein
MTHGSLLRLSRSLEVVWPMIDRWVIEAARQRVWRKGDFVERAEASYPSLGRSG